jgi:hypothetical protein
LQKEVRALVRRISLSLNNKVVMVSKRLCIIRDSLVSVAVAEVDADGMDSEDADVAMAEVVAEVAEAAVAADLMATQPHPLQRLSK